MQKYSLILILLISFACQTKKQVSKNSNVVKTDSLVIDRKESVSVTQNAISITEDINEFEIVPIDDTKPLIIEGKEYFNAAIKIKKVNRQVIDTTRVEELVNEEKTIEVKKIEKIKEVEKKVERSSSNFILLLIILIITAVAIIAIIRYVIK